MAFDSGRSSFVDTPAPDGLWREQGEFEVSGLRSSLEGQTTEVAGMTARWSLEGMDLQVMEQLAGLSTAATRQATQLLEDGGALDIEALRGLDEAAFDSGRLELDLNGFRQSVAADERYTVARARLELSGADFRRELSRAGLRIRFDGMNLMIPGVAAGSIEDELAPTSLDLDLSIEHLPGRAAWNVLLDGLAPEAQAPDAAAMSLMPALQQAGTRLRIGASRFASATAQTYLDGMIQAHAPAAFGAVLALSVDVVGLEAMAALARAEPGSPEAASILELVGWLQENGRPSTAPDGSPSHRVDIAVGNDGQLTVNGQPLPLFGAPPSEMDN
jgi:hypothetical protein